MFNKLATLAFLGMMATVIYVTLFNGDVNALKDQALTKMPGAATTISAMLPTATMVLSTPFVVDPGTDKLGGDVIVTGPPPLADCATAPTTTACEWKNGTPTPAGPPTPVPSPTRLPGPAPVFDTTDEEGAPLPTTPPQEPVLVMQAVPVSNVLSTTANYRSDCHAMFVSREDKSGWTADIAKCQSTGDYK